MHFSYEKAGLTVHQQPIPWNAEAVVVEALLRLQPGRRRADYQLRLPNHPAIPAETLRRDESEDRHRLFFRLPPPARTTTAEVFWHNTSLGQLTLPVLTRDDFLQQFRVQMPTLSVRLAEKSQP